MPDLRFQSARSPAGSAPSAEATTSGLVPLFPAACLFAAGIALQHWLLLTPSLVLIAAAALAALSLFAAFRAPRVAALPLALLWLLLGHWCASMQPAPAPNAALLPYLNGLTRTVYGTVVSASPVRTETDTLVPEDEHSGEPSATRQPTQRIDVDLSSIENVNDSSDALLTTSGRIRITLRWSHAPPRAFRCGDRITADLRLRRQPDYRDPGAWSRSTYLLSEGITATASATDEHVHPIAFSGYHSPGCVLAHLQQQSAARLLGLPRQMLWLPAVLRISEDDAVLLAAMATGDRTYLRHSLRVGFERTGSFHMLVVSGFHLAVLAACLHWIAQRLRLGRTLGSILTIVTLLGYALFTGFAIPIQRAFWMVTLYMLGRLVYRERSAMNAMGLAALCLLAAAPSSLFDASLQMTLLAVVAIGGIAVPLLAHTVHPYWQACTDLSSTTTEIALEPRMAEFRILLRMLAERLTQATTLWIGWRAMPGVLRFTLRLVELFLVSAVVELAMTLPMAIYFHRVTLFALPANMLLLPLLFLLLPAALLTLALLSLWPAAAALPGAVTALGLHLGTGLVRFLGGFACGDLRLPEPLALQRLCYFALLVAAVTAARHALLQRSRRLRWAALLCLVMAAGIALLPRTVAHPSDALLVEVLDVGQGDAILLIAPDGHSLLVDAGGFGGGPRAAENEFDIGEEVVAPALWARGIRQLDVVALSHAHSDHMGGMAAVLRDFHPHELWVGHNPPVPTYNALLAEARALGVHVHTLQAGDEAHIGAMQLRAFAPASGYVPGKQPGNNDSLVLRASIDQGASESSVFLEGDAEAPIEQAMLGEKNLASTLLKVGHHGSRTSSTAQFLARVHPQMAVISCGLHNRYHHPAPQTLHTLEEMKIPTLSTDLAGASCFLLKENQVRIDHCVGQTASRPSW